MLTADYQTIDRKQKQFALDSWRKTGDAPKIGESATRLDSGSVKPIARITQAGNDIGIVVQTFIN